MNIKRKFGWIKDWQDKRDHLFRERFMLRDPVTLPPSANLRKGCSPVEDQGELGSCTAQALCGALEYLELADSISVKKFQDLSRLFVYFNEREAEGNEGEDAGAMIRTGIKTLASIGVCRESLWPYNAPFYRRPESGCYDEAIRHKLSSYQRLQTVDEMRACLAGGLPFPGGFTVYKSMMTDAVTKTGDIPMPSFWEKHFGSPLGGHAILFIGYDDVTRLFHIRNSWGVGWGNGGYGTISYDYPVDDCWVCQKSELSLYAFAQNIEEVAVC